MQAKKKMTVIVGAGLAGLTCAKVLAEHGVPFILCEAGSAPGGRVVSRRTKDGYVLDRGFQVLLDSYPAAQRHLDLKSLGGGHFRAGALFVGNGAPETLENPLRNPLSLLHAARQRVMYRADLFRLAALTIEAFAGRDEDVSVADLLARRGFSERFLTNFARPFFGGVLLDPTLETSAALMLGYLKRFATGRALMPGEGIGSIGRQLAVHIPSNAVRYESPVTRILFRDDKAAGVQLQSGETLGGCTIVLATDEPSTCKLLGSGMPRRSLSTAVHYFSSDRAFYEGAWLCLPPRREECAVLHAALLTNVARRLAPSGSHLWSVTVTNEHANAADAEWVAREVACWFGASPAELKPIDYVTVPYAVPDQRPGFLREPAPWGAVPAGVFVAGDAVAGASIDAVMESGEAAAKKVISSERGN